jgi:hypothetical protein
MRLVFAALLSPAKATWEPGSGDTVVTFGPPRCTCRTTALSGVDWSKAAGDLNPATYGVGCAKHDAALGDCQPQPLPAKCDGTFPAPAQCVSEIKDWCSREWCYVEDPNECELAQSHSVYFVGMNVYYSYAACGEIDTFTIEAEPLRGKVLQVGLLNNSGGWHGSYNPNGHHSRDDLWYGPTFDFVNRTAEAYGFILNFSAPPPITVEKSGSGSAFWHCTQATSTGHLDLCIGFATITASRLLQSNWFQMQANMLYLVVPQSDNWLEALGMAAAPFTGAFWFLFLAVIVVVTGVATIQERLDHDDPQDWQEQDRRSRLSLFLKSGHLKKGEKEGDSERDSHENGGSSLLFGEHFFRNLFTGIRAVNDGSLGHSNSPGTRVTQLGLGIFLVVCVAAYTAQLTTFLVNRNMVGTVSSIEQAIRQNMTICGTEMGSMTARMTYPAANWVWDPEHKLSTPGIKYQRDVLRYLQSGVCSVAVIDHEDLRKAHMDGEACNIIRVGEPVAFEPVGMPLTTVGYRAKQLSNAFATQVQMGKFEQLKRNTKYKRPSKCNGKLTSSTGVAQLGVPDMLGSLVPAMFCMLVGVIFTCFGQLDLQRHPWAFNFRSNTRELKLEQAEAVAQAMNFSWKRGGRKMSSGVSSGNVLKA